MSVCTAMGILQLCPLEVVRTYCKREENWTGPGGSLKQGRGVAALFHGVRWKQNHFRTVSNEGEELSRETTGAESGLWISPHPGEHAYGFGATPVLVEGTGGYVDRHSQHCRCAPGVQASEAWGTDPECPACKLRQEEQDNLYESRILEARRAKVQPALPTAERVRGREMGITARSRDSAARCESCGPRPLLALVGSRRSSRGPTTSSTPGEVSASLPPSEPENSSDSPGCSEELSARARRPGGAGEEEAHPRGSARVRRERILAEGLPPSGLGFEPVHIPFGDEELSHGCPACQQLLQQEENLRLSRRAEARKAQVHAESLRLLSFYGSQEPEGGEDLDLEKGLTDGGWPLLGFMRRPDPGGTNG